MLRKIVQRFRESAAWREEHIKSFRDESARNDAGLTQFQVKCIEAISIAYPSLSFRKETHDDGSLMLVARLKGEVEQLYVYENEAGIFGGEVSLPFEEWDYRNPDELRSSLMQELFDRMTRER